MVGTSNFGGEGKHRLQYKHERIDLGRAGMTGQTFAGCYATVQWHTEEKHKVKKVFPASATSCCYGLNLICSWAVGW